MISVRGNLSSIDQLMPTVTPKKPSPKPEGDITVRIIYPNGKEGTFKARKVQFANYPKSCWRGLYLWWPFRWYTEDYIEVTRDKDGAKMKVKIGKLASVEVVGKSYSRKLYFKSLLGGELFATHIWKDLNADDRSGPSKWDCEKEGILLDLKDDLYVFLPFVVIKQIFFEWP